MLILPAGARVTRVRFLADGRLLAGLRLESGEAVLEVRTVGDGPRVRVPMPGPDLWHQPNQLTTTPSGDRLHLATSRLHTLDTADLGPAPYGYDGPAAAVIASPDGGRLVVLHVTDRGETVMTGLTAAGEPVWRQTYPHPEHQFPAGFADADRFLVVGGYANPRVTAHSFAAGGAAAAHVRHPTRSIYQPALSPDGRRLGVIGHGSLYLYDTATLGKAGQIKGTSDFGNFVSYAFHPAGRTMAVIHGGPTLVKLYDLDTLKQRAKLNWKVGKLTCLAFSPDGLLAAAGTEDGRVVVWDVDE